MDDILNMLLSRGLIKSAKVQIKPLAGGVSCDIYLIEEDGNRFVLKRALAKLRVKDDWFADVNRNRHEQDYLDYAHAIMPANFPRILHRDPEQGFFTMEYLGTEYVNWKSMLLAGDFDTKHATEAGRILGTIHRESWDDPVARKRFATDKNFYELRIEPYLITTGRRHPELQSYFEVEAKRLAAAHLCLVHGDFSPKNILISQDRMVVLDCEVAWFGDPAFDLAFLLNHLMLKMLHWSSPQPWDWDGGMPPLVGPAWSAYLNQDSRNLNSELDERTSRLIPMLMLARVDGKSPVEYLSADKQEIVRRFAYSVIPEGCTSVPYLLAIWLQRLSDASKEYWRNHPTD